MSLRRRIAGLGLVLAVVAVTTLVNGGSAQAAVPAFNNASGYTHFQSIASGKCLDVLTESTLPGFPVDQLTCRNAKSQEWALTGMVVTDHRTGGCGCTFTVYTITNHNGGNCVEVPASDGGNGAQVVQDTCTTAVGSRQWWRLNLVQTLTLPGPIVIGLWSLQSYTWGRCLDVNNGSTADELPMQVWDCTGGVNQLWIMN